MSHASRTRLWRLGLPAALVAAGLAGLGGAVAFAVDPPAGANTWGLNGSGFEVRDGDTLVANHGGSLDWDSLHTSAPADATQAQVDRDKNSGGSDDSFGNGTKEDTAVPSVVSGSIPPNKSDLKEFGSWVERNGNGQYLHLYWSRVQDPTGTTNMDFEFNQNTCTTTVTSGCSANGVTPIRKAGDLLITYDLANGGSVAVLSFRTWGTTSWGASTPFDPTKAYGSINGAPITSSLTGGSYSPRTFGEASINLSLIFDSTACRSFGGAYLKSRSSDAFSSAVKDFIAPIGVDLTNCGRLVLNKRAGSSSGSLLGGASFTIDPPSNASPGVSTMTSISTGVFCVDNLLFGTTYTVHESVTPTNYAGAADQTFTPTTANAGGCGAVTSSSTPNLTFVNILQTGSVLVQKVDGNGNALTGAAFTATLTGGSAASIPSVAGHTGLFCLDSLPVGGTYAITESTVPAGYNGAASISSVTISSASTCATRTAAATITPDRTVTNNAAPGTINIAKVDDRGLPLNGAGFTLYVDTNQDGIHQAGETTAQGSEVTTSGSGATAGTASFSNVPLDYYCVVETTVPTGYAGAPAQCVQVQLGGSAGSGQTLNLPSFTDTRSHKVIVLVCHEGSNTLDPSPVTVNGTTTTSLGTGGLPVGVTEAQLCGLGGSSYGGLGHGNVGATADVQ
ncbi:MAG: hypothetical protein JWO27_1669 [Frankiales bacterium]|nr:hypothetical protein [Frankiales bacterium]